MKVRDVMTVNPKSCEAGANLAQAAAMMWEADCGTLPVIDGAGQVLGMITDRDICIATGTSNRLASQISATELMRGVPKVCQPDDDLVVALRTMEEGQVRRLPVVDGRGTLEGILSLSDLLLRAENSPRADIPLTNVMKTLQAISQRRRTQPTKAASPPKAAHRELLIV